ncbi:TonB-dependent receptor [Hymenobacter sp. BT730]|uniref:SusC/RagA family TonB-linked outer membrane protein n=1 Tax=Hymenobacter sp. BT730 TaxID=3063332 RepID=UPI0026E02665|nr:TonB-dependent receptor [Hymenobacter sp. BT730]
MKKPVPKMRWMSLPALLCCLPLQPALAAAYSEFLSTPPISASMPADITVTGRVVDERGSGMPGVNVVVKGTNVGTQTDTDGRFTLTAPENGTLVFSFVGYTAQEIAVNNRSSLSVSLVPDARALSEVVVVGYLTQDRQNVTSSVSSLDVKEAVKAPVATATQALQGRLPGVQVQGSGGPGDAPVVNIRGIGTLGAAGSSPLYVIDGLWTFNIRDLNPNDIETLTVLKDASSTAVYGSSGANGVVLITTKKGKAGTPSISFNGYKGFDQIYKRYNLTNASDWADRAVQAYANAGIDPLNAGQNSLAGAVKGPGGAFNPNIDTDWQDEFFQTGTLEDYNLTFAGGTAGDKSASNFLISGEYFHQEGVVKGPDFNRYSLRLNSGLTRGRVKFQENAQFTHLDVTLLNGGSFIDVLAMLPSIPVYDPANKGGFGTGSPILNTFATNPIGNQELLRRTQADNRLAGNISTDVSLFDFLTYRLNVALDGHTYSNRDAQKEGILRQNTAINTSQLNEFLGYDVFLLAENTLNFNKTLGDHHFNALVGYSEQSYRQHNIQAGTQGFTSQPQYYFELSAGANKGIIGGATTENAKRSYFSQATYDFKNRYLVSASFRRDGSSRFAPQNRWGNFGAGSLGWRISEEDFFKNALPQVNNLKLRVSYGGNGNDALAGNYGGNYLTTPIIGQNVNYVLGTGQVIVNGSTQLALSSPDLQWEERYTKDAGLDLSVLNNRLNLSADYYISETRKVLAPVQVPTYLGHFGDILYQNAGNIENRGFELALGFHDNKDDFSYGADFSLTTIKNKITRVPVVGQAFEGGELLTRSELGTSLGEFYLIPFEGIFQSEEEVQNHKTADGKVIQPYASAGDVRYRDSNGDGVITADDRVYVGQAIPKLQMGLNLNAGYKGFDFSMFLQAVTGNKVYNSARVALESFNGPNNYNADVQPWTAANPSSTVPRMLQGLSPDPDLAEAASKNALGNTTRWLEDGDYLRLKNIQVGYTFPKTLTSRVPSLGSVRVYLTGRNVVTFTKYTGFDPEVTGTGFYSRGVDNSAYPNVRSFTGGLQVNF